MSTKVFQAYNPRLAAFRLSDFKETLPDGEILRCLMLSPDGRQCEGAAGHGPIHIVFNPPGSTVQVCTSFSRWTITDMEDPT